jgi:hypothetical protein
MDNETSKVKQHARLGIASCVAFLIATLIHFLNIADRFEPGICNPRCPEDWRFYYLVRDIELGAIFGLAIFGFLFGIFSFFDKDKKRLFGIIGIAVNSFWVLVLIALLIFPL